MIWCVYMVECQDTKIYTGITTDLTRRIREHNSGRGCRFTKYRRPVRLVFFEKWPTRSAALKREAAIKNFTRSQKMALMNQAVVCA